MATQNESNEPQSSRSKRVPTPLLRKRLEKCFEHASKQVTQDKFDYASELLLECVQGEPGNLQYLQSFVVCLQKWYGSAKKLGPLVQFKERGARAAVKKALGQNDWDEAIQNGLAVLAVNPWDVSILTQLAKACEGIVESDPSFTMSYGECELFYLKCAYDACPREKPDLDVCRQLAAALSKRKRFVEAINFWHKVEKARPDDEEAKRAIASLAVEQHRAKGGSWDDDDHKAAKPGAAAPGQKQEEELTQEDRLKRRIQRNPADMAGYDELAQYYLNADRFQEAEEVFKQKLKASNNDPAVREAIEDVQIRHLRHKMIQADKKFKETGAEADKKAYERIRMTVIEREIELFKNRCERYPNNLAIRFELAQRYQLQGDIASAIREFQVAKNDPRKRGMCTLKLGECFRAIKQYPLAMKHFEQAIEEIPDREADAKKLAYYRAGKLAMGLGDLSKADKFLSVLASMDFTYRDTSELLAKLGELHKNEGKEKPKKDHKKASDRSSEE